MTQSENITEKAATRIEMEEFSLYKARESIHPRSFTGKYRNFRNIGAGSLMALYFGTAWLNWGDRQAVLFDLPTRQFHIFGITLWPQDFFLLSCLLIVAAFALFAVTAFAGRVWCGYSCPQSVWTWMFLWAERVTEGDRNQRIKNDKRPMTAALFRQKTAKHSLWVLMSVVTGFTFVGYFTPIRELMPSLLSLDISLWALFWILFFAVATYVNAGWIREQVCLHMCPYARFQSAMFDKDTMIISYDESRGESRGPRKKGSDRSQEGLGDCIDCYMCVQVCPTGIDIRNGLQYECIGCAACVDACDDVMDKMGYQKGLVKYVSERELEGGDSPWLRPRFLGYSACLLIMIGLFAMVFIQRVPVGLDSIRDRTTLYNETPEGLVENIYNLKISNRSQREHRYSLSVNGLDGLIFGGDREVVVAAGKVFDLPVRLRIDSNLLTSHSVDINFKVQAIDDASINAMQESRFIGPGRL